MVAGGAVNPEPEPTMPTFIEALPERLSSKHGAIKWTPSTSTPGGRETLRS